MPQSPDPRDNEIVKVFHFIKWARADYIAARTLLLSGMLVQGAGLANTPIEKFLNAQCLQMGIAGGKTHDVGTCAITPALKQFDKGHCRHRAAFRNFVQRLLPVPGKRANGQWESVQMMKQESTPSRL